MLTLTLGCGLCAAQGGREEIPVTELGSLVSPGHRVAVLFKDLTGDIDEKDDYIREYLKEWSDWILIEDAERADFVIYVEGHSEWTEYSLTSKTYFMTASIRTSAGETLWKGEPVHDWANLGNGLRAVRGVSRHLVRSLLEDLRKLIGEAPVIVTV